MNIQLRLQNLMKERGWSEYRLAKEAKISQNTITNLFKRNNLPTLANTGQCKAADLRNVADIDTVYHIIGQVDKLGNHGGNDQLLK